MEAERYKPSEEKPVTMYQSTKPTPADNLLAVADMIRDKGMLCKEAWSRVEMGKRKGCAEGLLAEQVGLYNGFSQQLMQLQDQLGVYRLVNTGEVLNFSSDECGEDDDLLEALRDTDEWEVLAKTIIESDPEKWGTFGSRTVIVYNDWETTTAHDVEMMFRKAAIEASNL